MSPLFFHLFPYYLGHFGCERLGLLRWGFPFWVCPFFPQFGVPFFYWEFPPSLYLPCGFYSCKQQAQHTGTGRELNISPLLPISLRWRASKTTGGVPSRGSCMPAQHRWAACIYLWGVCLQSFHLRLFYFPSQFTCPGSFHIFVRFPYQPPLLRKPLSSRLPPGKEKVFSPLKQFNILMGGLGDAWRSAAASAARRRTRSRRRSLDRPFRVPGRSGPFFARGGPGAADAIPKGKRQFLTRVRPGVPLC